MTLDESDSLKALAKGISERIGALGQADWHPNSPVIGLQALQTLHTQTLQILKRRP